MWYKLDIAASPVTPQLHASAIGRYIHNPGDFHQTEYQNWALIHKTVVQAWKAYSLATPGHNRGVARRRRGGCELHQAALARGWHIGENCKKNSREILDWKFHMFASAIKVLEPARSSALLGLWLRSWLVQKSVSLNDPEQRNDCRRPALSLW